MKAQDEGRTEPQRRWTLSQTTRLLGASAPEVLYLCDQYIVHPDLGDAKGRGSSRGFSQRNLFEIALAVQLRKQLGSNTLRGALRAVRLIEETVREEDGREWATFKLPDTLREDDAPDMRLIISDGRFVYLTLARSNAETKVFGPGDLKSGDRIEDSFKNGDTRRRSARENARRPQQGATPFGGLEQSQYSRIETSLTNIAADLRL